MIGQEWTNTTGKRIRLLRQDLDLTQEELTRRLQLDGVSIGRSYISVLERSDKMPSGEVLAGLARALKTTTDYLLLRTEDAAQPEEESITIPDAVYLDSARLRQAARAVDQLRGEEQERVLTILEDALWLLFRIRQIEAGMDQRGVALLDSFKSAIKRGWLSPEQLEFFLDEEAPLALEHWRKRKRIPDAQSS